MMKTAGAPSPLARVSEKTVTATDGSGLCGRKGEL